MKVGISIKLLLFLFLQIVLFPVIAQNQDTIAKNKRHYLKLQGIVRETGKTEFEKGKPIENAFIKVYNDKNLLLGEFTTNKKGKCEFKVPINKQFIIEFSKPGYVSKFIEINTKMPPERKLAFIFPFEVNIFKEIEGLDISLLKRPVAKVVYNLIEHQFDYDDGYTNKINHDLKMLYKQYEELKLKSKQADSTNSK